jgi:hypothetical protein
MGFQAGFHAPNGGADFLGYRRTRAGATEVVYDNGVSRRIVWRLGGSVDGAALDDALAEAVGAVRVVPALMSELKKRAITVDDVIG